MKIFQNRNGPEAIALRKNPKKARSPPRNTLVSKAIITNSYPIQTRYLEPCPETGISAIVLYDEIGYPLTVQTVPFAPGISSAVHNHGTWGVVAVLKGQEKNTFWQRSHDRDFPARIEPVSREFGVRSSEFGVEELLNATWGFSAFLTIFNPTLSKGLIICRTHVVSENILNPGDIISFTPDAIHSIEAVGDEPTITFNAQQPCKLTTSIDWPQQGNSSPGGAMGQVFLEQGRLQRTGSILSVWGFTEIPPEQGNDHLAAT